MNERRDSESWRRVRSSSSPPNTTSWCATAPGRRTLWMVTRPSATSPRDVWSAPGGAARAEPGASAMSRAVRSDVPDGASILPFSCVSMISTCS